MVTGLLNFCFSFDVIIIFVQSKQIACVQQINLEAGLIV